MTITDFVYEELATRDAAGLRRSLRPVTGAQDTWVEVDGQRALSMCSNNYLGLANHPALKEAACRAAMEYGVGAGASRLVSGSMQMHHAVEERLATLKGAEAALLFNSGYHANIGVIPSLVGKGDAIFSDALNHASLIDGCRLSRAQVHIYPHNDMQVLSDLLATCTARRRLIVTDSIFSMDGDIAPLEDICDLAEHHGSMVMVDEAHATGVRGAHGGGVVEELGLQERITVQMGTLGKALGGFGAFVAAQRSLIDLFINTARSVIYTTALPPPVVAAADAALTLTTSEPWRREQLAAHAHTLRTHLVGLGCDVPGDTQILPVIIGDATRAVQLSKALLAAGVFVQAIRAPTVPPGTDRLRVTLMSSFSATDIETAQAAFQRVIGGELSGE